MSNRFGIRLGNHAFCSVNVCWLEVSKGKAMKTGKAVKAMKQLKAMKQAKAMKQVKAMKVKPRTVRKTCQKSRRPNGEFGKSTAKLRAVIGKPMAALGVWDGVAEWLLPTFISVSSLR